MLDVFLERIKNVDHKKEIENLLTVASMLGYHIEIEESLLFEDSKIFLLLFYNLEKRKSFIVTFSIFKEKLIKVNLNAEREDITITDVIEGIKYVIKRL